MILVKPSFEIVPFDAEEILKRIEIAGRICYKSEDKITEDSACCFVEMIIKRGHESVLEHEKLTVRFVCDRGVSHELVRHRIASFSQESTRYCNYKGGVAFVIPPWVIIEAREFIGMEEPPFSDNGSMLWFRNCLRSEIEYKGLLFHGWKPEQARSVLPNSLKTEIVVTANLREWRHILKLRTAPAAHPQMQELMIPLLKVLKYKLPVIFDDITPES